jgi:Type ISP C-terminal specificity domain
VARCRGDGSKRDRGLLDFLSEAYGEQVGPEDLFAYAYAVLFCPAYVDRFWDELTIPGPRLPLTRDASLFRRGVELGRELLHLHTYGERFAHDGTSSGRVPQAAARFVAPIPEAPESYPESFSYDGTQQTLRVGVGEVAPVKLAVYSFALSGHDILKSWLAYRMKEGAGRRSSPLDNERPQRWTRRLNRELLELVWVLEATVEKLPALDEFLARVLTSSLFTAEELPFPWEEERFPPGEDEAADAEQLSL